MTFIFICAQLPHESTVSHENTIPADDFTIARQRSVNNENKYAKVQHVPHLRPETPTKVTHHHDDDDFEETSSNSSDKSTWSHRRCYHGTTKRGGVQKPKLTWTIHVAWHQFSSTTMQQKRGGHKLNLHELPYCWLFPCFHCMKMCFTMLVFWTLFL